MSSSGGGGGESATQLPIFYAESKSANNQISLCPVGGGVTQLPTFDAESKSAENCRGIIVMTKTQCTIEACLFIYN